MNQRDILRRGEYQRNTEPERKPTMDTRLDALGLSVREAAEGCCDGCKGQPMLTHDADCHERCDVFAAEVKRLEAENLGTANPGHLPLDVAFDCQRPGAHGER